MAFSAISDGDLGSSARTTLNNIITYLNGLGFDIEFSSDNSNWHDDWTSGDDWLRLSSDFGSTWSDGIKLFYTENNGWDEAVWDEDTGILTFNIDGSPDETVDLDGRYALSDDVAQNVYEITLPSASTVAGRVSAAVSGTDYPATWTLAAGSNPADLDITHDVGNVVAGVNVFYLVSGTEYRQLVNFNNAYTGITRPSTTTIKIESLTTIQKEIKIYIQFAQ